MSKDEYYKKLLNAKRWKEIRKRVLTDHPLCADCTKEHRVTSASEVHHERPVEEATSRAQMEHRAYDATNLVALCPACHAARHARMKSHSKANIKENAQRRAHTFCSRYLDAEGGGVFYSTPYACKPTESKER